MVLVTEVAPPHTLPPSNIANSAPCTHLTPGDSPKLVELDFSYLLAKWVGYAPRAPSRRGPTPCAYPSALLEPHSAPKRGSSDAPLGHTLGHTPSGTAYRSS